jgi:hypothetical protein
MDILFNLIEHNITDEENVSLTPQSVMSGLRPETHEHLMCSTNLRMNAVYFFLEVSQVQDEC